MSAIRVLRESIALTSLGLCLLAVRPAAAGEVELPVTHVAIFSSGVAFYQCQGVVEGEATAELTFRTDQINDVIKSLVVEDLDGGRVGVVSYASRDPLDKLLASFAVDIADKPTLPELLEQLRGEPVSIDGAVKLSGVIFGVESRETLVEKSARTVSYYLNILTDKGLQQVAIDGIRNITLSNPKIDQELRDALAALATAHDTDKKTITLRFAGEGRRRVRVSYVLEAPIWKTTYRLLLDEEGRPYLQGWATVDNATERDWENVRLALVSGRPISFVMDLYSPIYVPRPREELELYASLRPPEYAAGVPAEKKKLAARAAGRRVAKAPAIMMGVSEHAGTDRGATALEADQRIDLADAGVSSLAQAGRVGELFRYLIDTPVSIPRQHSAMLPIVNTRIDGRKVSIYNPRNHAQHPLSGLEITNTSGLSLMQGPVTVLDGDTYAGDAKLPDLAPQEKRLVAYALDLEVDVRVERASRPDSITALRIVRGTLMHTHRYEDSTKYIVTNKSDRPKTVIIEHQHGDDWKLIQPEQAYERAAGLSRFLVQVPAHETVELPVRFEMVTTQSVELTNLNTDRIRFYIRARTISPAVREALQRVITLQEALNKATHEVRQTKTRLDEQVDQQARIRQNLKTLPQNSDVYRRQLEKFDRIETQIEKLQAQLAEAREAQAQTRKRLEHYLTTLSVE